MFIHIELIIVMLFIFLSRNYKVVCLFPFRPERERERERGRREREREGYFLLMGVLVENNKSLSIGLFLMTDCSLIYVLCIHC